MDVIFDVAQYEENIASEQEKNQQYLNLFAEDLLAAGLKDKTIAQHVGNASYYLSRFLLHYNGYTMEQGARKIGFFLGYYYISKCLWTKPANIKTTAASLKKLYKSMLDHGKIQQEDYGFLCKDIKENMDAWCADCAQYIDPDRPSPFHPGHRYC